MGPGLFLCALLCLIQSSRQRSVGDVADRMVSDGWTGHIPTDHRDGVPKGCSGKPADVYFVLDTASGASPAALSAGKRYLRQLAELFPLKRSGQRVGIVTYGSFPFTSTSLGTPTSLHLLQQAVSITPRVGGSRRTAQALKYLRQKAFSPRVARPHVAHVVILLTNGFSSDAKQTAQEASALRKQGVILYTVSTSSTSGHVDKGELEEMASRPTEEFVFSADSWAIVRSLTEVLHIKDCGYQVLPAMLEPRAACVSRRPTELAFAVEHLGLGTPKTQSILSFIQALLGEVDPDSPMTAAILTSTDPMAHHLSRHVHPVTQLEHTLQGVQFPDLSQLLRRADRALSTAGSRGVEPQASATLWGWVEGARRWVGEAQKVLLVFVDDSVTITKDVLTAARGLHGHKVDTYVIYVGAGQGEGQAAERVASGRDHVIRIPSYSQLRHQGTVLDTLRTVCRGL
ncbi:collagen alpha-1(XII) chain-like [Babylonia areolata]|uniref:collagen alpha-1(XII) chain-like n=1 Tax=Babylonia areolata TaxID=304850 RepID=UPI003FCFF8E9